MTKPDLYARVNGQRQQSTLLGLLSLALILGAIVFSTAQISAP